MKKYKTIESSIEYCYSFDNFFLLNKAIHLKKMNLQNKIWKNLKSLVFLWVQGVFFMIKNYFLHRMSYFYLFNSIAGRHF